jgi:hypothetical protein
MALLDASVSVSEILTQNGCALMQSDAPLTQAGIHIGEVQIQPKIELLG